jgi:alginate O-acetyltransferase complex protein AlgI
MLFNTWTFLVFLSLLFVLYYLTPSLRKQAGFQVFLLTAASYVFYAWHTPWLVLILAFSTLINTWATVSLLAGQTRQKGVGRKILLLSVAGNLLVLAVFKYASLLVETFLPPRWHQPWGFDLKTIPLPIGISFFTFQGISLVVDVYRKTQGREELSWDGAEALTRTEPRAVLRAAGDIAFFKAFFPQLIAGPIVKARQFMDQISAKSFRDIDWEGAVKKLILGYFLKMVVADNLREVTAGLAYPAFTQMPGVNLLFLLYAFSFQIFADFCGYSLIAMGLAGLFGYRLPSNFNFPYLSASITEFWKRWHISLSSWLKEYLYIPLGGNRQGPIRTYLNLVLVMLMGGLWHGAAWKFMFWGGAHGVFLAVERLAGDRRRHNSSPSPVWRGLKILLVFHLVSALWLLFQLGDLQQGWWFLQRILQWPPGISPQPIFSCLFFGSAVVLYHLHGWHLEKSKGEEKSLPWREGLAYAVMLVLICTNSGSSGAFIYFQF